MELVYLFHCSQCLCDMYKVQCSSTSVSLITYTPTPVFIISYVGLLLQPSTYIYLYIYTFIHFLALLALPLQFFCF